MTTQHRLWRRTLTEAVAEADRCVHQARSLHEPRRSFVLFSGGNDSIVMVHLAMSLGWAPDGVVHVNTGIGIPETNQFVRDVCAEWGLTLHELHPPRSYRQVFIEDAVIDGLPGPGMHRVAYDRLKDRALRAFVQTHKRPLPLGWRDRVTLLTGIRADESVKRMGYSDSVIEREGARVWVNPIYLFTDEEMAEYRALHDLPRNPVADHLHMSGECLCGSYAAPGEFEQIRFFYPAFAAEIEALQAEARERGLTYCRWGEARAGGSRKAGRLCQSCDARQQVLSFDESA